MHNSGQKDCQRCLNNPRQQILDSEDSEPTWRTVESPQGIDDFTIVLPELTDMAACELKVYDGLDRLWRMVERYKMTAPIAIRVVDNKARCVRAIRGTRNQAAGWQLEEETNAVTPPLGGEVEYPLNINLQDAKGNILKMRIQLGIPKPELRSNPFHD
jgi:hypothetical protein